MDRNVSQFKVFLSSFTDSGVVWRQHPDLLDLHKPGVAIVELDKDLVVGHGHVLRVGGDYSAGEQADVGRAPHGADSRAHGELVNGARTDLQNLIGQYFRILSYD